MVDHSPAIIEVEVAYALPRTQTVVTLKVPVGTTVREAIIRSGIVAQTSGWDWDTVAVGIFGKHASLATMLHEHDRVEIYRPLIADPKQARRKRARLRGDNRP
jgi:putative ubiquitin-RnfH superfamily antitoxin RatB of RatAB toxin-antitoxin module